ncbi:transposase [Rhodococcus ruber BKS 20-38]|uniref:Transposase n=1 Tax=Rhodococcus ruber BKS 20-38 TaxID=1278076 RepID=M2ZYS4_9NOCA|nr:IS701 family transposase [Rhodococcus ruber]EME65479.1 transposase [Rhodococcus ruber BKS 20-38]
MVVDRVVAELEALHERVSGRFTRSEPRRRVREYVAGLVAGLERKNGWTLAERAGEVSPDGRQRLLRRADWDVDGVRDDVRDYVVERLGDRGGGLIVDDTGFLKKGTRSAGVQRQYSGTAGRVENCQIGVFLAYASTAGHALIDRELYLPESWTCDRDRCRAAGIGDEVEFATKPVLAQRMIERVLDAGVPFSWLTADEAYGQVKYLRVWLEARDVPYVLATRRNDDVFTSDGRFGRVDEMIAAAAPKQWRRISVGDGAHGRREYSWVRVPIRIAWAPGRGHWLLARRSLSDPAEIAYYICAGPRRTTLTELATVAGSRWRVEECFQQAKGEAGLDQYQVRTYRAWYAHTTLSMLALAWLAGTKTQAIKGESGSTITA